MDKKIICIECPNGCELLIDVEEGRVIKVEGNDCDKGEKYAYSEIENPVRILTSTVATKGLDLKMIPVRTDKAIPKDKIFKVMESIKKIVVLNPVSAGDVICRNFSGMDVNLIATRKSK